MRAGCTLYAVLIIVLLNVLYVNSGIGVSAVLWNVCWVIGIASQSEKMLRIQQFSDRLLNWKFPVQDNSVYHHSEMHHNNVSE